MKKLALIPLFICSLWTSLIAGVEPAIVSPAQPGTAFLYPSPPAFSHQIMTPTPFGSAGWGSTFTLKSVSNLVKLYSDPNSATFIGFDYTISIPVQITYTQSNQTQTTINETLSINYYHNPNNPGHREYRQTDAFKFSGGCNVSVQVNGPVSASNPTTGSNLSPTELAAVAQTVFLQSEIVVERYYHFNPNSQLNAADFTPVPTVIAASNELEISWSAIAGAEEYDLEWIFVDDYGTGNYASQIAANALPYDFDKNAARVQIKGTSHRIPLVYERGYLLFRVRGIGRSAADNFEAPVPGLWSCGFANSTTCNSASGFVGNYANLCKYQISSAAVFEGDKMNWQAVTSFAEEGKHKTVVSFVDGSNRVQQTVTVLSSERVALVGESKYDFQGRAAIQILPVPVNDATIKFYPNFNQNTNGVPYSREDFDKDNGTCVTKAEAMRSDNTTLPNNQGAANYYSPSNPSANTGFNKYIPDAEGYPFVHTEYMPDNTGRIRRQGGVGPVHQLDKNRETQYFYGTPVQEELDRLFGNNMGNAVHYKKNMLRDANNQYSLTWLDPKGNTIATALGGKAPENLDTLPSYQTVHFDVDLLAANVKDEANYALTTVRTLLVSTAGDYNFTYTMTGEQFLDATCMDAIVCYDCIYDLELAVIDNLNCNDTIFHHTQTIGKLMEQILVDGKPTGEEVLSDQCETPPFQFNSTTDLPQTNPSFAQLPLKVGSYTIVKRLKVNEAAADAYAYHFINDPSNKCSQKYEDFLKEEMSKIDTFGCHIGCDDIDSSIVNTPGLTPEEINALSEEIAELQEALCDTTLTLCEAAYAAMLADVSPGGQYGYLPGTPAINPEDHLVSVYVSPGALPSGGNAPPYYQNSNLNFKGDNGFAFQIDLGNGLVNINDPTVPLQDFLNNWRDEWAEELLPFHPEYCYYEFCSDYLQKAVGPVTNLNNSEEYDANLSVTATYQQAVQKGFINPNNAQAIMQNDPFFDPSIFSANLAWLPAGWNIMPSKINAFVTQSNTTLSMQQMAVAIANCPENPTPACYNAGWNANGKGDLEWAAYRALYTSVKQEIIYKIRSKYAIANNCYNGCIGEDPFRWHLNGFSGTGFWNFPFSSSSLNQYCGVYTFPYFKNKDKRFPSVYDALPPGFDLDFYNDNPLDVLDAIQGLVGSSAKGFCCNLEQNFPKFLLQVMNSGQTPLTIYAGDPSYPADVLSILLQGQSSVTISYIVSGNTHAFLFQRPACEFSFRINSRKGRSSISDLCCFLPAPNDPGKYVMTVTFSDGSSQVVLFDLGNCDIKCPGEGPDCPLTKDAKELATVFSYLVGNTALASNQPIPGNLVGPYLAGALGEQFDLSWQGSLSGSTINGKILDDNGAERCAISLQLPTGVSVNSITKCLGIRPDTDQLSTNGHARSFFLKVKLANNTTTEIRGTASCLTISFCCNLLSTRIDPPVWGINTPEDVLKNCRSCNTMTITGGIFGTPEWTGSCFSACDTIVEYSHVLPDSCVQDLLNIAKYNADKQFGYYKDSLKAAVKEAYMLHCLKAVETFTVSYKEIQHHYTLYYYDQANNLVQTVPPAGVAPLNAAQIAQVAAHRKGTGPNAVYPNHTLPSRYRYNSLNQLTWQKIPDHKLESNFFYDGLGRLVASQNAKQRLKGGGFWFSYTRYDALGRIIEVGENVRPNQGNFTTMLNNLKTQARNHATWNIFINAGTRSEITLTQYDRSTPAQAALFPNNAQNNLRGRVAAVFWQPKINPAAGTSSEVYYSYDIHGNVETMVQKSFLLDAKTVEYDYDLISGKVNALAYQRGQKDQFHHRYAYDADNRLTEVRTSPDGVLWDLDAAYEYYAHGPLARVALGHDNVQGLDYAYTLHGWIKGMNSGSLDPQHDMGRDGLNYAQGFARDAVGFLLGYYTGDYKPIGQNVSFEPGYAGSNLDNASLYNGNIRHMVTAIEPFMAGKIPMGMSYRYDQLNRLKAATPDNTNFANNQWQAGAPDDRLKNSFEYDPNGNILTQKRNGDKTGNQLVMDSLRYHYYPNSNQLQRVTDPVPSSNYTQANDNIEDIDNQTAINNYTYDPIGNLTNDAAEKLVIQWNLQGKVAKITDSDAPAKTITFGYNPMGKRVVKTVNGESTYHAYDASGNVLATYRRNAANVTLESAWLYGSSRLGEYRSERCMIGCPRPFELPDHYVRLRGKRRYEQSNHLGNVLAVVSDRKLPVPATINATTVDYFNPDVITAQDYYAFGMLMAGRTFASKEGRFGFNGMEVDDEVKGSGNYQDYGMRCYDGRLGRFIGVDIHADERVSWTPYNGMRCNPILNIDPTGGLDTDYNDENGNLIKHTEDGVNRTVTVKNADLKKFNMYLNSGNKYGVTDSKGYNDVMVKEFGGVTKSAPSIEKTVGAAAAGVTNVVDYSAKIMAEQTFKYGQRVGNTVVSAEKLTAEMATTMTKVSKIAGVSGLGVGTLVDAKGVYNYYVEGPNSQNAVHPAKATTNLGIGAWGLINPGTAIASTVYFLGDAIIPGGWPAAIEAGARNTQNNREILGQNWNPRPMGGLGN
ncbi:MAG: hypothetical protein HUU34_04125 [Saprospiraceae bacterium]|nr:hypothetical protein [Saprospiraceae bacterium]